MFIVVIRLTLLIRRLYLFDSQTYELMGSYQLKQIQEATLVDVLGTNKNSFFLVDLNSGVEITAFTRLCNLDGNHNFKVNTLSFSPWPEESVVWGSLTTPTPSHTCHWFVTDSMVVQYDETSGDIYACEEFRFFAMWAVVSTINGLICAGSKKMSRNSCANKVIGCLVLCQNNKIVKETTLPNGRILELLPLSETQVICRAYDRIFLYNAATEKTEWCISGFMFMCRCTLLANHDLVIHPDHSRILAIYSGLTGTKLITIDTQEDNSGENVITTSDGRRIVFCVENAIQIYQ